MSVLTRMPEQVELEAVIRRFLPNNPQYPTLDR
jgi:hypothetical protein